MTCEPETAPRVTVDSDDPALNGDMVSHLVWYHTSTQPNWPTGDSDPAARLTDQFRQMMGGDDRVASWADRQRSKALHVGTYEAAIYNMLRRIADQADHGSQFYLCRVHLKPTITVREGWLIDPSDFVGDVILDEVCPPGIDVARYLNHHEDPGGLSLALGRAAIAGTQQVAIPPRNNRDRDRVAHAVTELANAVATPPGQSRLIRKVRSPSPKAMKAREIADRLAHRLPVNLRFWFQAATAFNDAIDQEGWARYVVGLVDMIEQPERMLAEFASQDVPLF